MPVHLRLLFVAVMCPFFFSCGGVPEQRPSLESLAFDPPVKKEERKAPRKLCIFMDGTSNGPDSQTHIRHLYELVSGQSDPRVICFYDSGVGAERYPLTGAAGGAGFSSNVREGYAFLASYYRPGDQIYIFGYSRGARQAMVLSDLVCSYGLPNLDPPQGKKDRKRNVRAVAPVLARYKCEWRKLDRKYRDRRQDGLIRKVVPFVGHRPAEVEVVGLWDNVDSLMYPVVKTWPTFLRTRERVPYRRHRSYGYHLPQGVKRSYHAAALDERRGLYELIPWIVPPDRKEDVELVWFPGSHGDIGGSYDETELLSRASLEWMLTKLSKHGLIDHRNFNLNARPEALAKDSRKIPGMGLLAILRHDRIRRDSFWGQFWGEDNKVSKPLIHQSVIDRIKAGTVRIKRGKKIEEEPYQPSIFLPPHKNTEDGFPHMSDSDPSAADLIDWIKRRATVVQ